MEIPQYEKNQGDLFKQERNICNLLHINPIVVFAINNTKIYNNIYKVINTHITQRVSGDHGISQYSIVGHIPNLGRSIPNCWILPYVNKLLQNFWLAQVFHYFSEG